MTAVPSAVNQLVRKHGVRSLLHVAKWLLGTGRDLWNENLTPAEREEFKALVSRSKGRRKNLTGEEITRLSRLVVKALFGKDGLDFEDLISIAKSASRRT